jgi:DNA repair exonuclease SbcCD ATPase subunit
MDARIWTLAAVAVFFLGLASFTGHFSKLDTAQNALKEAQKELKELEDELEDNASTADSKRAAYEELTTLVAVHDGLVAKKKTLSDEIENLEGRKSAGLKVFRDTVTEVRSKSVGNPWADVPFRNGQILRQVRIQKVTDTDVTLAHAEGLAKLTADELPADLKDRFRLGMEPFLSLPSDGPALPSLAATVPSGSRSSSLKTSSPTEVEAEISAHDAKVLTMETTRAQWRSRATSLRFQTDNAKGAGRPSYTLNQQATEAERQLATVEQQLTQMRIESDRLRKKLIEARNAFIRARISDSQR